MPDARTLAADLAARAQLDPLRSAEARASGGAVPWHRVPPPARARSEAKLEFRVVQDRPTAEAFHAQLIACYARYGAGAAAIAPPASDVVYLVVEIERRMVAGIRLHRRGANRLPLESYFAQEPTVIDAVDRRTGAGLAELCGLWSAPEVARTGIGGRVVGAAVAIAPYFGVRHLCSFAHQFNRFTRRVGFIADEHVGDRPYPDARYRSTLNWCDAAAVTGADADVREQICRLRQAAGTVTAGERLPLALELRN